MARKQLVNYLGVRRYGGELDAVTNQMPYATQTAANVSTKNSSILSSFRMAMSRISVE